MGNIRPTYIKSLATDLLRQRAEAFSDDFEQNKHLVEEYTNIDSKVIRNRVAGYITRKMKSRAR